MGKSAGIISRDSKVMSTSYGRECDFVFHHGKGVYVFDVAGKKHLDFAAGISVMNAGYAVPSVLHSVYKQLALGTHCAFPDFYAEMPVTFSENLLKNMPSPINHGRVFLSNSGTESVECAMKLAKWKKRRPYMIAFDHCFHGRTMGSLSMTNSKPIQREGFAPFLPVKHVPYPYHYRMKMEPKECSEYCLSKLENAMKQLSGKVSGLFLEPIQGEGGYIVPPKSFVRGVRKLCTEHDVLLCDDEIQAGAWRTGKFLAIENFGVKPDIVSMAKAIGGGLPLGATIAKPALMDWPEGTHSNTFGGNLLACAAGLSTLKYLKQKNAGKNALVVGKFIMKMLKEMEEKYEIVGDVRGLGLMIGIEIVEDKKTRKPNKQARNMILQHACDKGLILLAAGTSVIRMCPPLIINKKEAEKGLDMFESAIKVVSNG
jgi:4-aminobutyrate aminotransferase